MYLDLCEKFWTLIGTDEKTYDAYKCKKAEFEAYFTEKELADLMHDKFKLIQKFHEDKYEINGFINYFLYQKI